MSQVTAGLQPGQSPVPPQISSPWRDLTCKGKSCADPPASTSPAQKSVSPNQAAALLPQSGSCSSIFLGFLRKCSRRGSTEDLAILPSPPPCFGIPVNKKALEEWQAL